MEIMEVLLLMICTFQMKKNVQQYMAMVSRLFSIKFICFAVNNFNRTSASNTFSLHV